MGINGGYGPNSVINPRIPGDMTTGDATYVDFNTMGHKSASMDFHYEMSIPLATLGTTAAEVASKGMGVMVVTTMGVSGMDCLPYDFAMNDNADLPDTRSQEINSYEKSDSDEITVPFARIGKSGEVVPEELEISLTTDKASPQTAGTDITLKGTAQGGTAPNAGS